MNVMLRRLFAALALVPVVFPVRAAETDSMMLFCSPAHSLAWSTLSSSRVDLNLTWPEEATSATLNVTDIDGATVHSASVDSGVNVYSWTVFPGDAPAADSCFTVNVTYFSGEAELSSERAVLTLFKGTFAPVDVFSGKGGLNFSRTTSGCAVAYDSRWFACEKPPISLAVEDRGSGAMETFSSGDLLNGYFVWNPSLGDGRKSYDFTLSCGGDTFSGRALLGGSGTVMILR